MEELDRKIEEARKSNKQPNYELADLLREKINKLGYRVENTPNGTKLYKSNGK